MLLCLALMKHSNWSDQTLKQLHSDIVEKGSVAVFWMTIADEIAQLDNTKELTWAMKQIDYDYKDMLKNIDALEDEQRELFDKEDEAADAAEMRGEVLEEVVEEGEVVTA